MLHITTRRTFTHISLLGLVFMLSLLVLTACGEQSVASTPTASSSTTADLTTVAPTPAIEAIATPTPPPSNTLILGDENQPSIKITRYVAEPGDNPEDIDLNPNILASLQPMFGSASSLAALTGSNNQYQIVFSSEVRKALADGSAELMLSKDGGFRAIAVDSENKIIGHGSIIPFAGFTNPAILVFNFLSAVGSFEFMTQINNQYETINAKLDDIKTLLQTQQISDVIGPINSLEGMQATLNKRTLSADELEDYKTQLSMIKLNTFTNINTFKSQVEQSVQALKKKDFSGENVGPYHNDSNAQELRNHTLPDFKQQSNGYLLTITTPELTAQVSCSILFDLCQDALDRLDAANQELENWLTDQYNFYGTLGHAAADKNGLGANDVEATEFTGDAAAGKETADSLYKQVAAKFQDTSGKIKAQLQNTDKLLTLVVMLDDQGNIKKVSKLTQIK